MDLGDVKIEEVRLENDNGSLYKYNNELLMLRLKGDVEYKKH